MPTYEYRCTTCGARFDYFQSIKSDALTTCPVEECRAEDESLKGKGEVKRIVSGGAGVVFKGEGFYLTDYARKKGGGGGSEETEKSGTGEKSGTRSESGEKGGTKSESGGKGSDDTSGKSSAGEQKSEAPS